MEERQEQCIHVASDTDCGVVALCGGVDVFAVYPKELSEYSPHQICHSCEQLYSAND